MNFFLFGFNDHFQREVEDALLPFRVFTRNLRNAAIHLVADRFSQYVGTDEAPTRSCDIAKVFLQGNIGPQLPRSALAYAQRLVVRLNVHQTISMEDVERIIDDAPPTLLYSLCASAAVIIAGAPFHYVVKYTPFQQRQLIKAVSQLVPEETYVSIAHILNVTPTPSTKRKRSEEKTILYERPAIVKHAPSAPSRAHCDSCRCLQEAQEGPAAAQHL